MSKTLYFVWVLLLIAGVGIKAKFFPASPPSDSVFKVRSDLPLNHQLQKGDILFEKGNSTKEKQVAIDSLIGQHLVHQKKANEEIKLDELSPVPAMDARQDSAVLLVPLAKGEEPLCNLAKPHSRIVLCSGNPDEKPTATSCFDPIEVVAAHQATQRAPRDYLVLWVPQKHIKELSRLVAAKSRNIAISVP